MGFTVWNSVRVPGTNYIAAGSDMEINIHRKLRYSSMQKGQVDLIFTQIKQDSKMPDNILKQEKMVLINQQGYA